MILDKAKMAHEYAMKHVQEGFDINYDVLVVEAWKYADAMQAEADKREPSGFPNVLRCACGEIVAVKVDDKEWQPDWSQAPDAKYWAIDSSGFADWFSDKPELDEQSFVGDRLRSALQYGYTGDWQDSLRKRPQ